MAITHYTPAVAEPRPSKGARPWLPWAITGAAIMLALMAFGAGQALQPDPPSEAPTQRDDPDAQPIARLADPFESYDRECSNRDHCELSCAKECTARCTDASSCEISVGPDSRVYCDRFDKCEVRCAGDCEVECPQGGCEVTCPHPADGNGKKPKKPKSAKKCGTTYVCGDDCDDD
jgi:hypothetical protein